MKKKLLTLALAGTMALSVVTPAMADGKYGQNGIPIRIQYATAEEIAEYEAEVSAYMATFDGIVPLSQTGWKLDEKYRVGDGFKEYPGYVGELGRIGVIFNYAGRERVLSNWKALETALWATEWADSVKHLVTGNTEMEKAVSAANLVKDSFPYDESYPADLNAIYHFRDRKQGARLDAYAWLCRAVGLDVTNCTMWSTEVDQSRSVDLVKIDGMWYWSDISWYDIGDYADRALSRTLWQGSFDMEYNAYANADGTPRDDVIDTLIPAYTDSGIFLKEDGGFN